MEKATVLVFGLNGAAGLYRLGQLYRDHGGAALPHPVFSPYLEERYGTRFAGHMDSIQALKYRQLEELWESLGKQPHPSGRMDRKFRSSALPLQFLYTVDFPESTVEVAVTYTTRSDGVRKGTADWQHTFTYLLSPARHWADFVTLDLTVDAGRGGYPYVIGSSALPLEGAVRWLTLHPPIPRACPEDLLLYPLLPRPSSPLSPTG